MMVERGVLRHAKGEYFFFSDMTLDNLVLKLKAIDDVPKIVALWQGAYKSQPEIILCNPHNVHWYYMQFPSSTWDLQHSKSLAAPMEDFFDIDGYSDNVLEEDFMDYESDLPRKTRIQNVKVSAVNHKRSREDIYPSDEDSQSFPGSGTTSYKRRKFFDETEKKRNTTSNTYSRSSSDFFVKIDSSPQNLASTITPSFTLAGVAWAAKNKLKAMQTNDPIILKLIAAYDEILQSGSIGGHDCIMLTDPIQYSQNQQIPLTTALPKEVLTFTELFRCEIAYKAHLTLITEVPKSLKNFISFAKDLFPDDPGMNALEDLEKFLTSHPDIEQASNYLNKFDFHLLTSLLGSIDETFDDVTVILDDKITYLRHYQAFYNTLSQRECAASILNLLSTLDKTKETEVYKTIFEKVAQPKTNTVDAIDTLDNEALKNLIHFKETKLATTPYVGKAIKSFVVLFSHDLVKMTLINKGLPFNIA
jgi:hypothetical protein